MGFTEFKRLGRRFSSRLFGVDTSDGESDSESDSDSVDAREHDEDGEGERRLGQDLSRGYVHSDLDDSDLDARSVTEQGPSDEDLFSTDAPELKLRRRSRRARTRWREAYRKVVVVNRFLDSVSRAKRRESWFLSRARRLLNTLLAAAANAPVEVLETRAMLGIRSSAAPRCPDWPQSPWHHALFMQAVPLCMATSLISALVPPFYPWEHDTSTHAHKGPSHGPQKSREDSQSYIGDHLSYHGEHQLCPGPKSLWTNGNAWWRAALCLERQVRRLVVLYPAKVAFARLVALGQPIESSIRALGWRTYNGFSAYVATQAVSVFMSYLTDKLLTAQALEDSLVGPALGAVTVFATFVTFLPPHVVCERTLISAPDTLYPASQNVFQSAQALYLAEGWQGFFSGFKTMMLLAPMEIAVSAVSKLAVRLILGPTRKEQLGMQVEQVRESLELKKPEPIHLRDVAHLETLVASASRHHRIVLLLLVNVSHDSKVAMQECQGIAEHVDATFAIADARNFDALRQIAFSSRFPCFLPIANGSVEANCIVPYRFGQKRKMEHRLRKIVRDLASQASASNTTNSTDVDSQPQPEMSEML